MERSRLFKDYSKRIGIVVLSLLLLVSQLYIQGDKNVVYAADTFEQSIAGFPESYKPYLRTLHNSYSNWKFVPYNTGYDFATAVKNESCDDKSLTHSNYSDFLKSNAIGDYNMSTGKYIAKDGSTWITASKNTVAYFMDPRNFLNDTYIYMFENLAYDSSSQTQAGVEAILKGSFMANTNIAYISTNKIYKTTNTLYSAKIMEAAKTSGISAYYIASKMLQEIGKTGNAMYKGMGASGSISGTYSSIYTGIYNFYNIGASTSANPILNGLAWASNSVNGYGTPWDTPSKSIIGGAKYIGEKYINLGQNTTYLQRFNVTNKNTFKHQYMTNVFGCAAETMSTADAYKSLGIDKTAKTFNIPVYSNMPGDNTTITYGGGGDTTGTINSNVNVRKGPSTGYAISVTINAGDTAVIKENVLTDRIYSTSWLNNPYWCKIEFTKNGKEYTGYISAEYITPKTSDTIIAGTSVSPTTNLSNDGETVYYRSDEPRIATVDDYGKITGKSTGTTTIRAFTANGKFDSYTVAVYEKGCILNTESATLNLNKTLQLSATVYPLNSTNKNITWTSSNNKVATVTSSGKVKGISVGTATIYATAAIGGVVGKCTVKVIRPVTGVSLNRAKKTVGVGKTYTLTATVAPANATIKTVKWKSSDKNIATVKKGVVTAKAPGTVTITATTKNESKTATCTIKVIPQQMTFSSGYSYNDTTVKLKWSSVANITGYKIYRKNSAGKYKLIKTLPATAKSYKDKYLKTGSSYTYKIRAYKTQGNITYYGVKSLAKTVKVIPKRGKIVSVTPSGASSVKVIWQANRLASGHEIFRKATGENSYKLIKTINSISKISYINKGLTAGVKYAYKIRAFKIVSGKKVYGKYSKVVSLIK